MICDSKKRSVAILLVLSGSLLGGCGGSQKTTPLMGFGNIDVQTQICRDDIVVLDRVEGTSTTESICGGAVQIIDGDKWKVLGIPFFKEKYTYFSGDDIGLWATTADRAYYKALEAAPEADAVFVKSMDNEDEGIPIIWQTKTVTWRGKAIKLVADQ